MTRQITRRSTLNSSHIHSIDTEIDLASLHTFYFLCSAHFNFISCTLVSKYNYWYVIIDLRTIEFVVLPSEDDTEDLTDKSSL